MSWKKLKLLKAMKKAQEGYTEDETKHYTEKFQDIADKHAEGKKPKLKVVKKEEEE